MPVVSGKHLPMHTGNSLSVIATEAVCLVLRSCCHGRGQFPLAGMAQFVDKITASFASGAWL